MSFNHFQVPYLTSAGDRGIFECTPDNTELYWHSEQWMMIDHIFPRHSEEDRRLGAFIWRHILGEDQFKFLAQNMIQSGEWAHHYRPQPTESDIEQYAADTSDIPDEIPDDFS